MRRAFRVFIKGTLVIFGLFAISLSVQGLLWLAGQWGVELPVALLAFAFVATYIYAMVARDEQCGTGS